MKKSIVAFVGDSEMESFGPEAILDLMMSSLPLSGERTRFVSEVFQLVMSEVWNLDFSRSCRRDPLTTGHVKQCAEHLLRVMDFVELAGDEREKFLGDFPLWRIKRSLSVCKLREIAESILASRRACSKAQIVGGSVGILGGMAIIGSILCPAFIPALIPYTMAVGGGIAAGAGGVAQMAISVEEAKLLHRLIKEAKEVCESDARDFEPMVGWFRRTDKLDSALTDLFDIDILDIIFRDLKDFFGSHKVDSSWGLRTALKHCVGKIINHPGFELSFDPTVKAASLAVVLAIFLAYRQNRQLFSCVILTQRLGLGLAAGLESGVHFGRLIASAFGEAAELIPRTVDRKVAVAVFAGLGIVLDTTNVILNSIDLLEGSDSLEQRKINEVADGLQDELDQITQIYDKLSSYGRIAEARRDFFRFKTGFFCVTVAYCFYIIIMMYFQEANSILQFVLLIVLNVMNYFLFMKSNVFEKLLNISEL